MRSHSGRQLPTRIVMTVLEECDDLGAHVWTRTVECPKVLGTRSIEGCLACSHYGGYSFGKTDSPSYVHCNFYSVKKSDMRSAGFTLESTRLPRMTRN